MAKLAKIIIMLVRGLALVGIVLGILVWSGRPDQVGAHMGVGFLITILVAILAIVALIRRVLPLGVMGLIGAALLPWVGFRQFPLVFRQVGAIQVAHVIIVLAVLGIAESSYAAIRKTT